MTDHMAAAIEAAAKAAWDHIESSDAMAQIISEPRPWESMVERCAETGSRPSVVDRYRESARRHIEAALPELRAMIRAEVADEIEADHMADRDRPPHGRPMAASRTVRAIWDHIMTDQYAPETPAAPDVGEASGQDAGEPQQPLTGRRETP